LEMDDIDRRLLASFQADARCRNADLARELGVAPSSMLERVRRLEERGYFKGFRALLNPEKLGYTVQGLVSVSLAAYRTKSIRPFEEGVRRIPYVRVCYNVSGRFDYILLVVAKDVDHLGALVKEQIASLPGVDRTETFIVFSEIKSDEGYPIPEKGKEGNTLKPKGKSDRSVAQEGENAGLGALRKGRWPNPIRSTGRTRKRKGIQRG